jgi:hypothetical protein
MLILGYALPLRLLWTPDFQIWIVQVRESAIWQRSGGSVHLLAPSPRSASLGFSTLPWEINLRIGACAS